MKKLYQIAAVAMSAMSFSVLAQSMPSNTQNGAVPVNVIAAKSGAKAAVVAPQMPGVAVSDSQLDAERGKADTVNYDARLDAIVTGNSATNVATGANSIDTGSFANMVGLPVVIQNSGANVLIQNSTIVNVQFR